MKGALLFVAFVMWVTAIHICGDRFVASMMANVGMLAAFYSGKHYGAN